MWLRFGQPDCRPRHLMIHKMVQVIDDLVAAFCDWLIPSKLNLVEMVVFDDFVALDLGYILDKVDDEDFLFLV